MSHTLSKALAGAGSPVAKVKKSAARPAPVGPVTIEPFTDEDEKELESLRMQAHEEREREKRSRFKSVPANVRQAILDLRLAEKVAEYVDDAPYASEETIKKIEELCQKRELSDQIFRTTYGYKVSKCEEESRHYGRILSCFSTDTIEKLHAEATLEEEVMGKENA